MSTHVVSDARPLHAARRKTLTVASMVVVAGGRGRGPCVAAGGSEARHHGRETTSLVGVAPDEVRRRHGQPALTGVLAAAGRDGGRRARAADRPRV